MVQETRHESVNSSGISEQNKGRKRKRPSEKASTLSQNHEMLNSTENDVEINSNEPSRVSSSTTSKPKKKRSSAELYKILPLSVKQDICFVEFISSVRVLLEDLVEEFILQNNDISFNNWKSIWKEKVMSGLFHMEFAYGNANSVHQCILQAALELLTKSIHEISTSSTQLRYQRIFGSLFCLYCCYFTQLSEPKFKISVDPSDWMLLMSFEQLSNRAKAHYRLASKEGIEMLRTLVKKDVFMKCLKGFKYEVAVKRKVYEEQKRAGIEVLVPVRTIKPPLEDLVVALQDNITSAKNISVKSMKHIESLNERYSNVMTKLLEQPIRRGDTGGRGSARFMTTTGGKVAEQQQAKHKQHMESLNQYVKMLGGFVKSTNQPDMDSITLEQQRSSVDLPTVSLSSAISQAQVTIHDEDDELAALAAELEAEIQSSAVPPRHVIASRTPTVVQTVYVPVPAFQLEQQRPKAAATKPKSGVLYRSDKTKTPNVVVVSSDSDDALAELESELNASIGAQLASAPEPSNSHPTPTRQSARRRARPVRNSSNRSVTVSKSDDSERDELLAALEEELQAAGKSSTNATKTKAKSKQATTSNAIKTIPRQKAMQKKTEGATTSTKQNTSRKQVIRPTAARKASTAANQKGTRPTRSSNITKANVTKPSKAGEDSEAEDDELLAALEQELETTPTLLPTPVPTTITSKSLPPVHSKTDDDEDDELAALDAELNALI